MIQTWNCTMCWTPGSDTMGPELLTAVSFESALDWVTLLEQKESAVSWHPHQLCSVCSHISNSTHSVVPSGPVCCCLHTLNHYLLSTSSPIVPYCVVYKATRSECTKHVYAYIVHTTIAHCGSRTKCMYNHMYTMPATVRLSSSPSTITLHTSSRIADVSRTVLLCRVSCCW